MLEFAFILLVVVLVAITINGIEDHNKKAKSKMSFWESLKLTGLPIVTFSQGDKDYNFLLDTGSNCSNINVKALESLDKETTDREGNTQGLGGDRSENMNYVKAILEYKENKYEASLLPVDMSIVIDDIKKETGVTVHGLLGSDFFHKYKYVLDFKEFIAYQR